VKPPPKRFTVGILGSLGADKAPHVLLQAWKKLGYKDATLMIGGKDSTSDWARHVLSTYGGGNVRLTGWLANVSDLYDNISLLVVCSATEGFNCEAVECMAHGRPVICSDAAGAVDLVPTWYRFKAGNVDELASKIDQVRLRGGCTESPCYPNWRGIAENCTWDKIRERYKTLWRALG